MHESQIYVLCFTSARGCTWSHFYDNFCMGKHHSLFFFFGLYDTLSEFSIFMYQLNPLLTASTMLYGQQNKFVWILNISHISFISSPVGKSWNKREDDVFPLSGSYCMTFMCSSVRVRPDSVINIVMLKPRMWYFLFLCASRGFDTGNEIKWYLINALTSSQLLNRIVQEISVNSWTYLLSELFG